MVGCVTLCDVVTGIQPFLTLRLTKLCLTRGCSGVLVSFPCLTATIIIGYEGTVVSKAAGSFLDVRDESSDHVASMVAGIDGDEPTPRRL